MPDPYDPEIELRKAMAHCEVTQINGGHSACFNGQHATFRASTGPGKWTEEIARKSAVFFWCLKQRELQEGR
jgi:hypothetical protein